MTSQQLEALQNYQDAAAALIARSDEFAHAFGQDHPDITAAVQSSAQGVGETAHTVAMWAGSLAE